MFPFEHGTDHILGRFRDTRRNTPQCLITTTCVPFLFSAKNKKVNHACKLEFYLGSFILLLNLIDLQYSFSWKKKESPRQFNCNIIHVRSVVHSHQIGHCRRCRVIITHIIVNTVRHANVWSGCCVMFANIDLKRLIRYYIFQSNCHYYNSCILLVELRLLFVSRMYKE